MTRRKTIILHMPEMQDCKMAREAMLHMSDEVTFQRQAEQLKTLSPMMAKQAGGAVRCMVMDGELQ